MFQEPGPKVKNPVGLRKIIKKKNSPVGTNPFPLKDIWKQSLGVSLKCANINSAGYCNSPFSWSPSPLYSHTHPPLDLLVSALDRDNSFPGSLSLTVADGDGTGRLKNPAASWLSKVPWKRVVIPAQQQQGFYFVVPECNDDSHSPPFTLPPCPRRSGGSGGARGAPWRASLVGCEWHPVATSPRDLAGSSEQGKSTGMGVGWFQTHAPPPTTTHGDFSPPRVSEAVGLPLGTRKRSPHLAQLALWASPGLQPNLRLLEQNHRFSVPMWRIPFDLLLSCPCFYRAGHRSSLTDVISGSFNSSSLRNAGKKVLMFMHTFACEIANVESWMVWAKAGESPCTSLSHCKVQQRTSHLLIQIQALRAVQAHAVKAACCRCKTIKPKCSQAHQQPDLDAFKVQMEVCLSSDPSPNSAAFLFMANCIFGLSSLKFFYMKMSYSQHIEGIIQSTTA